MLAPSKYLPPAHQSTTFTSERDFEGEQWKYCYNYNSFFFQTCELSILVERNRMEAGGFSAE